MKLFPTKTIRFVLAMLACFTALQSEAQCSPTLKVSSFLHCAPLTAGDVNDKLSNIRLVGNYDDERLRAR